MTQPKDRPAEKRFSVDLPPKLRHPLCCTQHHGLAANVNRYVTDLAKISITSAQYRLFP
jgi:hypothetical protein